MFQSLATQWAGINRSPLGVYLRFPRRSFCSRERMGSETSGLAWYFRREFYTLWPPHPIPKPNPHHSMALSHPPGCVCKPGLFLGGHIWGLINWQDGVICDSPARRLTALIGRMSILQGQQYLLHWLLLSPRVLVCLGRTECLICPLLLSPVRSVFLLNLPF